MVFLYILLWVFETLLNYLMLPKNNKRDLKCYYPNKLGKCIGKMPDFASLLHDVFTCLYYTK